MNRLFRFCVIALIAVPLIASADDYKENYGKAISKIDKGKWSEAEQLIREALADNPSSSTKKMRLYGNRTKPYLPYFHLGFVLFEQGDCQGALSAWATAEQQGAVQSFSKEYSKLSQRREECRQQLPAATPTRPPLPTSTPTPRATPTPKIDLEKIRRFEAATKKAKAEIKSAEAAATAVRQRHGDSSYSAVWKLMADARRRESDADDALKQARTRLSSGTSRQDQPQLDQAYQLAEQARKSYELVAGAADSKRSELTASAAEKQAMEAARNRLFGQIEEKLPAAQSALNSATQLSREGRRQFAGETSTLKGAVDEAGRIRQSSLSVAQLEELRGTLDRGAKSYRRLVADAIEAERRKPTPTAIPALVATEVPSVLPTPLPEVELIEKLKSAAGALMLSDYESVVGELEVISGSEGREVAAAYLLRGAGSFYLYLEGGEQDPDFEMQARNDIKNCREADASLTPDALVFSPAFVIFFAGS